MRITPALIPCCLGLAIASACSSSRDLRVHDDGIVMPSLRADFSIGRKTDENGKKIDRFGITAEATGAEGEPSATSDYQIFSLQVLGRYRFVEESRVRARALFGLEYVNFDAEERAGPLAFSRSRKNIGPAFGADVGVRLTGPLQAYGRATFAVLLLESMSARGELGLRAQLARHFDVFAGYRWWEYEISDVNLLGFGSRDLELETEGLVLGMGVRF